ncbi:LamG-like jellyroll fold domain-containing protein [Streptomyces sp. NPDC051183]|uniref:LamG-like jellyroll fold domain-containing protein n=1 Tax=Streptomyces sp. NPDC051183 TaxID=3155165 RepID=UPI00343F6D35
MQRSTTAIAALLTSTATIAATLLAAPAAHAAGTEQSTPTASFNEQILFRSGTAGYGCFRIPTLTRTATGALLAFAEARTSPSCADRGPMDIVVRRSTNDGRTWGPVKTVFSGAPAVAATGTPADPEAPYTHGNASPVADLETGDVFLLSTAEPTVPGGTRLPYVQKSTDDGLTFGPATELPRLSGKTAGWFGTGPSHGIQLRNPAYAGRLVVAAYEEPNATTEHTGFYYSDDHGASWKVSEPQNTLEKDLVKPTEPALAELSDGTVYVSARNERPKEEPHRLRALSKDGGASLVPGEPVTDPAPGQPARHSPYKIVGSFSSPQIQASVLAPRLTYVDKPGDLLLAAAPGDPQDRNFMEVRYSKDGGETWTTPSGGRLNKDRAKYQDRAGYSDLAELAGGEIGLVYEGGDTFSAADIHFKRFTAAGIGIPAKADQGAFTNPQTAPLPGRTTPDSTPQANDAYLAGNADLTADGRFRQGLALDGTGDFADVPYADPVNPRDGAVTYSLHFRHDGADTRTTPRVLMWAYGYNAVKPQVWIRTYPQTKEIKARVEGEGGRAATLTLAAPEVFAATAGWYHLALVRSGNTATLALTDETGTVKSTSAADAFAGSLTSPPDKGNDGIRLGAKPDAQASDAFKGALDDFRVYRTALGADDRKNLATGKPTTAESALTAHLAFQVVDRADPVTAPAKVAIVDDVSGHCADASLLLGPGAAPLNTPVDAKDKPARMGKYALKNDAAHPGVEVPYTPAVDTGEGDFTHTLWFRYSATTSTPGSVLMWAYGVGTEQAPQPSLWVRTDPAKNRLHALAETDGGKVYLELKDTVAGRTAFGDNEWHLLTVTRESGTFKVQIDTPDLVRTAQGEGLAGSFTAGRAAALGLRLGSRPGTTEILDGSLDDYRLYHRALSGTDVAAIAKSGSGTGSYPKDDPGRVWWSMEHGTTERHDMYNRTGDGPATPDDSAHCNNAYVRGADTTGPAGTASITGTGGRFGGGINLDGTDDHVELPLTGSEALGAGDFTLATWVRYDAAAAAGTSPVISWAYGMGSNERQLWLRADPDERKITALLQTENGTAFVAAADTSFRTAKDAYHHVVLRRENGALTLSVTETAKDPEGKPLLIVTKGSATAPAGSVTHTGTFAASGLRLGVRPDGADRFKGSLDEFTLVRRSLTDNELKALRETNTLPAGGATVAHLSFEKLSTTGYARM